MKKLSIYCGIALVLALTAGSAYAVTFGLDIDQDGTVDIPPGEITLSESETMAIDIYLTDWPPSPPPSYGPVGAVLAWFELDTGSIELDSYSSTDPAWDLVEFTETTGKLEISIATGGSTFVGPDVYLATVVIHCLAAGTDWVRVQISGGGVIMDTGGLPYSNVDDLDVTVIQTSDQTTTTIITPTTSTSPTITTTLTQTTTTTLTQTTTTTLTPTITTTIVSTTTTAKCLSKEIYGEDSERTEVLRNLRDGILTKTKEGQEIIKLYYEWSPAIVKAMEEDEQFKKEVKELIDEILTLSRKELE